jgi:hypothetical protein
MPIHSDIFFYNFDITGLSSLVDEEDSKVIIVAIAVGVTCILMLLITIAVVMARMNR